ncbi:hypothetical protein [Haliovirga abyssi]|uniref:Intracellular proteinase inhibitor BsuPI domain-containing protein n=1 Tax=Haliovirga abyssi TaxID=2996794 RepID=A0AAU9DWS5_9FUSO|nr:hypothetical protein [Haliovirga abyssi]BDU50776.1 hypothetical protein HLVA_13450 [Haliovirga abyssi]
MNSFFKKKSNIITILDLIFIFGLILLLNYYFQKKMPTKQELILNNVKYSAIISKYKIDKDEALLIKVEIKNRSKKPKYFILKKENSFNFIITKGDKIIYKKDILEKNASGKRKLKINGYSKIVFSDLWMNESNTEEAINSGEYELHIYSKDFNIKFDMNFFIN